MDTLASWIAEEGRLPAADAVGWVVRLAKALEPIHLLGIAHGRLSTEAIVTDGTSCQGQGAVVGTTELSDAVAYHDPDRARGKEPSIESDTWAVAVVLHELLTGRCPFEATTHAELLTEIGGAGPAPLSRFGVENEALQQLLRRALALSRKRRLRSLRALRNELVEIVPDAGQLKALALGSAAPGDEGYDEIDDAVTQKLDDVTALTRYALIKKGAIPDVTTVQPAEEDDDEDDFVAEEDAGDEPVTEEALVEDDERPSSLIDEDEQAATHLMDVSDSAELAALRMDLPAQRPGKAAGDLPPPKRPPPLATVDREPSRPSAASDDDTAGHGAAPDGLAALPKPSRTIDFGEVRPEGADEEESDDDLVDVGALDRGGAAFREPSGGGGVQAAGAGRAAEPEPPRPPAPPPAAGAGRAPVAAEPPSGADVQPSPATAQGASVATDADRADEGRSGPVRTFLRLVAWAALGAAISLLVLRADARQDFASWVYRHTGLALPLPGVAPTASPQRPTPPARSSVPAATALPSAGPRRAPPATASAASGDAPASSAPSASAEPGPAPPPPVDVATCVQALFPADTFAAHDPKLDFLCTEQNPRKGATELKSQIVLGGGSGRATPAMEEWALLEWYEMGAFAVVRGRCCSDSAPPLSTPASLAHCQLDDALDGLRAAAAAVDVAAANDGVADYTKALHCLYQVGAASVFGLGEPPKGGARSAFEKLIRRVCEAEVR